MGGIRSPAGETLARVEAYATPLLLVKPFAAQGPLETSFAPTSIIDVSATVLDFAGLSDTLGRGTSVMGIDPAAPRERVYGHHDRVDPSPFFDLLHMFAVNGRVTDPNAWSYYRSVFGPTDDRVAQRRERQVGLSAVPDESATESGARIYGADRYAVFYLAPENPRVTFDVRRMPPHDDQPNGDRTDRRPGRRPTRTRGRRVAHVVLSGDGAIGRQSILHRVADEPRLVRRDRRVLGPYAAGRNLTGLSLPRQGKPGQTAKALAVEPEKTDSYRHGSIGGNLPVIGTRQDIACHAGFP